MRGYRLQIKRDYATETNFRFATLYRLFEFLKEYFSNIIDEEIDKVTVKVFIEDEESNNKEC